MAIASSSPRNASARRAAQRPVSATTARAAVLLKAVLEVLNEAGGALPVKEMLATVESRLELTAFDLEFYENSGKVRWQTLIDFFAINFSKAGFIAKRQGQWSLTPEGRTVLSLPAEELFAQATRAYREWRARRRIEKAVEGARRLAAVGTASAAPVNAVPVDVAPVHASSRSDSAAAAAAPAPAASKASVQAAAEADARTEMERFIRAMTPYGFQHLIAALLRAMGYTIPFESAPGADGGTDILAYRDPLGARTPHIRVQVKHRKDKARREEVAALRGIIRQQREIGLFVSSSGFTADAVREARNGAVQIELLDWSGVVDRWLTHYERMSWEDRSLLRLRPVYFPACG